MATYATYRHVELDNVGYGKKRVLKPPGGGSSDIFGAAPEETSPRRVKNHNQSELPTAICDSISSNYSNREAPRSKPGNDSHNRLFGPPAAPPTTPNAKNHMRSNISLSGDSSSSSSVSSGAATSPAKSTASSDSVSGLINGYTASNGSNLNNDITGGTSCIKRNPVTGDGVDVTPIRRSARRCRDGNPVTGFGYTDAPNNGLGLNTTTPNSYNSRDARSSDTSPAAKAPAARSRVPPGGYTTAFW